MTWYIIRTATRQERRAAEALKEQKFDTFSPTEERWSHIRSRKVKVGRPLFPGYMFVCCEPKDFYTVVNTDGVHQFVRFLKGLELEPMPFPDECVGDLMSQQAHGLFDLTKSVPRRVNAKKGDRAKIIGGKWRGYIAEVLSTSAKTRRAVIMLETINDGRVKMTLDVGHLDAA